MEPVLIATKADHTDLCAVVDFTLDMVIGHDRQDFKASFDPIEGVGGGSLLYIDGTEYGGVVDDVTTDTETGIASYHGRTWDGILAAKRIMPPSGSAYRTVSGEANSVLASLVTLLDIGSVFAASTAASGITISSYQFDRFVDAYEGIYKMLQSAGAKLVMHRENGVTVMEAKAAATISDEADSDLLDFMLTKTNRTVNHLVCAGEGELQDRVVIDLYADASGNVSQVQSLFGIDEITDFYDYNNADAVELLAEGTKKLQEYQTKGAVEITHIGSGEWDVGDTLVARDNKSGTTVSAPIVGKTVKVDSSTNWELSTSYEVGEVSRTAATVSGTAEQPEKVNRAGDTMTGELRVAANHYTSFTNVCAEADTTKADNGLTETIWPRLVASEDKNGLRMGGVFNTLYTTGSIRTDLWVYQHDSNGNQIASQSFGIGLHKDGTPYYSLSNPEKARAALGIHAWGQYMEQTGGLSLSTSSQKVPLKTFAGQGCSSSSNGIKVEQAGDYVVSGSVYMSTGFSAGNLVHVEIFQNSTLRADCLRCASKTNPYETWHVGPIIITCAAGDVLYLHAYNQSAASGTASSRTGCGLTVYQIDN